MFAPFGAKIRLHEVHDVVDVPVAYVQLCMSVLWLCVPVSTCAYCVLVSCADPLHILELSYILNLVLCTTKIKNLGTPIRVCVK